MRDSAKGSQPACWTILLQSLGVASLDLGWSLACDKEHQATWGLVRVTSTSPTVRVLTGNFLPVHKGACSL